MRVTNVQSLFEQYSSLQTLSNPEYIDAYLNPKQAAKKEMDFVFGPRKNVSK